TDDGNFENGASVLHVAMEPEELARLRGMAEDDVRRQLEEARKRLLAVREKRVRPPPDDKVLTGWNGLVISALARAAAALDEPAWLAAARGALAFVRERLMTPAGDLLHSLKERGEPVLGLLEDYAYLPAALVDLYEATLEPEFLKAAQRLARR